MDDNNIAVLAILDNQTYKPNMTLTNYHTDHGHTVAQEETDNNESNKQNIIWTKDATLTLLSIYESKMHMLDNPKKKTKMWSTISEELRAMNIEVNTDQVRWKINALTKKYKDCIEKGQGESAFKYFNEMHQILGQYGNDTGTYRLASGIVQGQPDADINKRFTLKNSSPFRRLRSERKAKLEVDKQWIEYLRRQDEQKQIRLERCERNLRLKEEEMLLRKKELDMKHSLALKKLQLKEKKHEEFLKIEQEKCSLLRKLLVDQ